MIDVYIWFDTLSELYELLNSVRPLVLGHMILTRTRQFCRQFEAMANY